MHGPTQPGKYDEFNSNGVERVEGGALIAYVIRNLVVDCLEGALFCGLIGLQEAQEGSF